MRGNDRAVVGLRRRTWVTAALLAGACACAYPSAAHREAFITSSMTRADLALLRSRAPLVEGKYARMAGDPFAFYRGSLAVFAREWREGGSPVSRSRFALDAPLVPSHGDPHPENFGLLMARDGTLALEANDLDAGDRLPYLWDVRRLVGGCALMALRANGDDPAARALSVGAARSIARAAAASYARALAAYANGAERARITEPGDSVILADLFTRGRRDADRRQELAERTRVLEDGRRVFVRGALDPEEPSQVQRDLPGYARGALPELLLGPYRASLVSAPGPEFFRVLDAVRELGSGVASWPRVRVLVLVSGPTESADDDVVLEVKELADGVPGEWLPPGVWSRSIPERVRGATASAWAIPDADPLWSTAQWLGMPVQVRTESEAHKSLRVERMVGERGTVSALEALATQLGALVARVHAADVPAARVISTRIETDREGFADEQADAGLTIARRAEGDHARFCRALARRDPSLGLPVGEPSFVRTDLAALFYGLEAPASSGSEAPVARVAPLHVDPARCPEVTEP